MRSAILLVLVLVLAAAGCSSKDQLYLHSVTIAQGVREMASDRVDLNLGIEAFGAISELNSLNLLARESPDVRRYQTYEVTQLWSTMPATMVTESALAFFEPRFAEVEDYPGSYVSDLVLRASLTHFEEIRGSGTPQAVVGLRYQILIRQEPTPETRFERIYKPLTGGWLYARGEEPLADRGSLRDGTALTVAMARAMEEALEEIWRTILQNRAELPSQRGEFRGP